MIAGALRNSAEKELELARESGDAVAIAAAEAKVKNWSEGGAAKTLLHGAVGAAMASLGGGDVLQGLTGAVANQMASNAMGDYLVSLGYIPGTPEFDNLFQLGSLAVGAAVGGGTGASTALSATQNNYLNHAERMEYLEAALQCAQTGESCGLAAELEVLSESRNEALRNACTDRYSDACTGALQHAIAAAEDHQAHQGEYLAWMKTNGGALWSAGQEDVNETLIRNIVTQTTTEDLIWKIDCARAGSNCSTSGSMWLLTQGDVEGAARHEAMRTLLEGAGKVGGVGGRAIDTVVGLYDLLKEASPVTQLGNTWTAIEYVQEHGLEAYLDTERAKSAAMRSGLLDSAKGYLGDIGTAIANNLQGGPQWDIYDVLMQGNTEGKVGFDVLGLFVGGTELNAITKGGFGRTKSCIGLCESNG